MCFSPDTLAAAKAALPGIPTYWLIEAKYFVAAHEPLPSLEELIQRTHNAEFDGLNFDFNWPVDAKLIQKVKESGLKCYLWTVDNPEDARWLAEAGIDGITSNRPLWLREKLGE
jgi:glycerophosphoryl diester phosphodiesterase